MYFMNPGSVVFEHGEGCFYIGSLVKSDQAALKWLQSQLLIHASMSPLQLVLMSGYIK